MTTAQPPLTGLTTADVNARLARGESNAYRPRVGRTYADILRDNLFSVFNIVLFTLLGIVLFLGDYGTVFFAGFSVVSNTLLGLVQEILAKRKLDRLAALAASAVTVIRDGAPRPVPLEQIVKDDTIPLQPGDRLVVDGELLAADALEIDESQLTGESDPVFKEAGAAVYSGSYCLAGSGIMRATRVGADSTINRLSATAKAYKIVLTPTQARLAGIVELTILLIAVCTPMYFVAGLLTTGAAFTLETFRAAVIFIASIVPQGLVLTATVSLSIGAIRLSRHQTLVQRINAVEGVANVTALCFDKTGTLTRNKLHVSALIPLDGAAQAAVEADLMRYTAALSSHNTTAAAIAAYLTGSAAPASPAKQREIPFTSARKWGAVIFPDRTLIVGAPERVLPDGHPALAQAHDLAADGLRVLALAQADPFAGERLPDNRERLPDNRQACALIVLEDQLRDDTRPMLDAFRAQGVALKVISGDNPATVRKIATDAGMTIRTAYTGDQLAAMHESALEAAAWEGDLFARVEPDTKRRLIEALKRQGAFVAMVGDGVNDVPALKAAHLALVMNDGAPISKDVGDLVLLDNDMSTLPRALAEGRAITQSIYATSRIFLIKNLYSALFFLFAGFMAMPFPIGAIQISIMTLFAINIPAALYAFRVLHPVRMRAFRADVLDQVVSAGVIGALGMTLNFTVIYFASALDTGAARSGSYVFLTLWGVLALWNTQGIDLLRPVTITPRWKGFVFAAGAGLVSIAAAYLVPSVLLFTPPTPGYWALIASVFALCAAVTSVIARTRGLAGLIWRLTAA
ncbi:MAG: HAD-IC family P-type ATPase [bacterium]|nr:HAD-IC family P-type ATPase [bacterium]